MTDPTLTIHAFFGNSRLYGSVINPRCPLLRYVEWARPLAATHGHDYTHRFKVNPVFLALLMNE